MPRAQRPTMADVARAAGVAPSTVSKSLSPHGYGRDVSPEVRQRIVAAAQALGFETDWARRLRARHRRGNIGLLYVDHPNLLDGNAPLPFAISAALQPHDFRLIFVPVGDAPAGWMAAIGDQGLDGCVIASPVPPALEDFLTQRGLPTVLANLPGAGAHPRVVLDDRGSAHLLGVHLREVCHRRVLLAMDSLHASGPLRVVGLEQAGLECELLTRGMPQEALARAQQSGATAIIGHSSGYTRELHARILRAGLRMPEQLALASFGDHELHPLLTPSVTAVELPMTELFRSAAELLLTLLDPSSLPLAVPPLPGRLHVRASTGG